MTRWTVWFVALLSGRAAAHSVDFELVHPVGIVQADGGVVPLRWQMTPAAEVWTLETYVTPRPLSNSDTPWERGSEVLVDRRPLVGPAGEVPWNTSGLAPGCYQPFALVITSDEATYAAGPAKIVVRGPTSVPPAIWVTNARTERVDAFGRFHVRFRVVDPDSPTTVTLKYGDGSTEHTIVEGLSFPPGATEVSYAFDVSNLPVGYYDLYAESRAEGEPSCGAYWESVMYVPGGPYADGGTSLPAPDAASSQPPRASISIERAPDAVGPFAEPKGCAGFLGALLLAVVQWSPRRDRTGARERAR